MSETEIREQMNKYYQAMVDSIPYDTFVLSTEMEKINKDIVKLQNLCENTYGHNFRNKKCQWCDRMEV